MGASGWDRQSNLLLAPAGRHLPDDVLRSIERDALLRSSGPRRAFDADAPRPTFNHLCSAINPKFHPDMGEFLRIG